MYESIANEFEVSEFDTYKIYYHSGDDTKFNLQLHIDLFQGELFVGRLKFIKNRVPLPSNEFRRALPFLHYSIDEFESILQIITLAKPLYIMLHSSNGQGMISTSKDVIPF